MKRHSRLEKVAPFLIGVGVGIVAGLYFAPASGAETRERLADAAREGLEEAKSAGRQLRNRADEVVSQAKRDIRDAVEAGEKAYREAKVG